jgi:23S rRNA pseudouridine1911/1915/1917 synthase
VQLRVDDQQGDRLDSFLARELPEFSRSRIQALIKDGHILLNGARPKPRQPVTRGDLIAIHLPEPELAEAVPQDLPLSILFEDDDLIVVAKAPGMVVHPAAGNPDGTLVNALLHHCHGRLAGIGGIGRPGIVHRLDKDTSGCLVAAKTDLAHQLLVAQFADRSTEKRYLAVTQAAPAKLTDTIFTHIGRHPVNRQKMAVVNPPGGKPAITDYQVLATDPSNGSTLVLCHLHTGRTHQIRVHLAHIATPLVGDPIYAKPARQKVQPGRLMLHAWQLGITHPRSGARLAFEAPIPPEFAPWLDLAPPLTSNPSP